MTSSRTSKNLRLVNNLPEVKTCNALVDNSVNQFKDLLNSFWFNVVLSLFPKRWSRVLRNTLFELSVLRLRSDFLLEEVVRLGVDLDTYKHNSVAQKEKTKRYSELRKFHYVENNKNSEWSPIHEHENGL